MHNVTTITIPIKTHLKKYISRRLQCSDNGLLLSTTDILGFGIYVIDTFTKKRNYYINDSSTVKETVNTIAKYGSTLNLQIRNTYACRSGIFINDEKIFFINKFIDRQFRNDLYTFIASNLLYNPDFVIEYGVKDFLSNFGITCNDIDQDTIMRNYRRVKNSYLFVSATNYNQYK